MIVLKSLIGALALYFFLTQKNKYWQKRGVPCAEGALPGVGHMFWVICMKKILPECLLKFYENNMNSMLGFYKFTSLSLIIIEPKLVKTVLQTNFASSPKAPLSLKMIPGTLLATPKGGLWIYLQQLYKCTIFGVIPES